MLKNKNIVITSAVRTAIGTFRGSLKDMCGHELGSAVVKEGDYGIVIGYAEEESCAVFDYLVVCNGIQIYLFNYEVELVT